MCFSPLMDITHSSRPFLTKPWRTTTDTTGIASHELLSPFTHCLVGNDDPTESQHVLDHAKA